MELTLPVTAAGAYEMYTNDREPFLRRGREAVLLTLPALIPQHDGPTASDNIVTPWQSVGARGSNNLSSKLHLTLLPPNSPFFRYSVDEEELVQLDNEQLKDEIDKALSKYERKVLREIQVAGDSVALAEALKHLVVVGNALLYMAPEGLRVFHLHRYVIRRSPSGKVLEIVVKETMTWSELPEDFQEQLRTQGLGPEQDAKNNTKNEVDVYTWVRVKNGQVVWHQEAFGKGIPGTQGRAPEDKSPWLPLRWSRIDGEDYGRGHVEEYMGDLQSLEALTQAITEGAAAAARLLILVNPNGTTSVSVVNDTPNGGVAEGRADDVTILQMDKRADFAVAERLAARLEQRLEYAFLLHTAIQRDAERVTAEEIRYMAGELEASLGGVYSIMAQEFQLPYVVRRTDVLVKARKLPRLPKDIVQPSIVTGFDALGRGQDRNRLVGYLKTAAEILGPQVLAQYVNVRTALDRLAAADGVDNDGLIHTQEEIQANQQQAQLQALIDRLGPEALKQFGNLSAQGMQLNGTQQEAGG